MAECDMADEGTLFQTGLPMSFLLRDATLSDIPAITGIYQDSVLNGVASYEMTAPDEAEMAARFSVITGNGSTPISLRSMRTASSWATPMPRHSAPARPIGSWSRIRSIWRLKHEGVVWARRCLPS